MGESPIGAIPGTGYGFLRAARAVIGACGGAGQIQARRVLPIVPASLLLMSLDSSVMNVSIATVARDVGCDGHRDPDRDHPGQAGDGVDRRARIGQRWPTVGSAKAMTMGRRVYRHCSDG